MSEETEVEEAAGDGDETEAGSPETSETGERDGGRGEEDDGGREPESDAVDGGEDVDETGSELEELRREVESLREENRDLEQERDDLESRLKRVQADFENYKKRAEEKVERARKRGVEDVVEEVVGVKDDVERAIESMEEGDADADLWETLEMLDRRFEELLEGFDVERVEPDRELDPERHEAVMRVDSSDHDEGEVVDVHEPGYVIEDRVVRTAKVSVASGGPGEDDE